MQDNPYNALIGLMRQQSPDCYLATAVADVVCRDPLTLSIAGMRFSGAELLVNADLMDGGASQVSINTGTAVVAGVMTVTKTGLDVGDRLLAMSPDGWETIYALCRVVTA